MHGENQLPAELLQVAATAALGLWGPCTSPVMLAALEPAALALCPCVPSAVAHCCCSSLRLPCLF